MNCRFLNLWQRPGGETVSQVQKEGMRPPKAPCPYPGPLPLNITLAGGTQEPQL